MFIASPCSIHDVADVILLTPTRDVVMTTRDESNACSNCMSIGRIPMLIAELSLSSLTVSGQQNAVPMLSAD